MIESEKFGSHLNDGTLWQWHSNELEDETRTVVQYHLRDCASCRLRAEAIGRLINTLHELHETVQPTLAEQMQLLRALKAQFAPVAAPSVWLAASRRLVRWLAPAVAVLAVLLLLLRHETAPSGDALSSLLPEIPESHFLLATTDEQLQAVMLEVALSAESTER
ncbi:MAG: hypothetical protein ONB44_20645 [candidate division KSB1 bacterium]|nr:hypothetical protein [candidate division KSB1 bacterium]MDZ7304541.1 hypothetical protein [candidate division KSB1 bacterium]MDZ7313710.1 hypothetical protein [candidate division KSB1 bacterium]